MRIRDVYNQFIYRVDRLATNASQHIAHPQFVAIMNKAQLHWAELRMKSMEVNKTRVDELQQLLSDYELVGTASGNFSRVKLPSDYFHLSRTYSEVKECRGVVYGRLVEEGNINVLLQDSFTKPSAAWEETLVTIFKGHLRVYVDGFTVGKTYVKYYRLPRPVNIAGYVDAYGVQSSDVDLEFNDVNAQEIIDLAAQIALGDVGDMDRLATISQHIQSHN